jgi:hypothetical protein
MKKSADVLEDWYSGIQRLGFTTVVDTGANHQAHRDNEGPQRRG